MQRPAIGVAVLLWISAAGCDSLVSDCPPNALQEFCNSGCPENAKQAASWICASGSEWSTWSSSDNECGGVTVRSQTSGSLSGEIYFFNATDRLVGVQQWTDVSLECSNDLSFGERCESRTSFVEHLCTGSLDAGAGSEDSGLM